ncbi:MAG: hypothetical protein LBI48_01435 [Burkholderiaceae bacterium]|nr:hypothetical protein [Burkholderiaceae bacterium]
METATARKVGTRRVAGARSAGSMDQHRRRSMTWGQRQAELGIENLKRLRANKNKEEIFDLLESAGIVERPGVLAKPYRAE